MTANMRIREIVVAGGGIVGWSAAAMLRRRLPGTTVTVVGAAPADAVTERIGSTLPSIGGFHGDIGMDEGDVFQEIGASFRLGTLFEGWSGALPPYVHAYGEYGRPFGTSSFHHHWVRLAQAGAAPPFDSHSPAAGLGRAGQFVHPQSDDRSPLGGFEYGLNLDPDSYRELMRAYAVYLGAVERPAAIRDVRIAGDTGFVEALVLEDGEVPGHLFIDCTGPAALVRSRLDRAFEEWGRWLPCDRVMIARGPGTEDPPSLDMAVTHPAGWAWQSASRASGSRGLAYASSALDEGLARQMLGVAEAELLSVRAGRRPEPWLRNCVAIGDAAVAVDPLEWTNLHLAHSALDRIVAKMPGRDCSEVELWDYNREAGCEADRVRDFLALHYATAQRQEPFWRALAGVPLPASLDHTLSLFEERGRLPQYEEETFSRHSWLAVLLGQGVLPRRVDPLIETFPAEQSEAAMAQIREMIEAMIPKLPSQGDYIRQISARAAQ